ncbi:phosphotransferase [Halobacillus sp. A1]|uniref:phosphotransferase n=1 Tax=Halobacillus sp. A1 TaxID=2880262 RepID=UPI0020A6A3EF|nr:phosphotransferase [Halobacillus sp. A1]MCP3030060.1 phosphotransferase [Halobacillus sp. A1]
MGNYHDQYHQYLYIGDSLYINSTKNLISVLIDLYFKALPFSFIERKTRSGKLNNSLLLIRLIRVFQLTYKFHKLKRKVRVGTSSKLLYCKAEGDFLLKTRNKGIKIFNIRNKKATTLFAPLLSSEDIENRINTLKQSEKCSLAPALINTALTNRYYTETYVNCRRTNREDLIEAGLEQHAFSVILDVLRSTPPSKIDLFYYRSILKQEFESLLDNEVLRKQDLTNIKEFVTCNFNKLKSFNQINKYIILGFSHGDLWEGNILQESGKSYVIDWETLGYRSCYFDYYFFMIDTTRNQNQLKAQIEKSYFTFFTKKLKEFEGFNSLETSTNCASLYKYLFFTEWVILKLSEGDNVAEINKMISRFQLTEKYIRLLK